MSHPMPGPAASGPSADPALPEPGHQNGPSRGIRRWMLVLGAVLAFLALPVIVLVLRFALSLAGWMTVFYLMGGMLLHTAGGVAVGLSLLLLPRVNPWFESATRVRPGRWVTGLLVLCWATGLAGPLMVPDFGDAPDSAAVLDWAEALWGTARGADITFLAGTVLTLVSGLSGLGVVVLCAVRRSRAPRESGIQPGPHGSAHAAAWAAHPGGPAQPNRPPDSRR